MVRAKNFLCGHCDARFSKSSYRNDHIASKHPDVENPVEERLRKCKNCNAVFQTTYLLKGHKCEAKQTDSNPKKVRPKAAGAENRENDGREKHKTHKSSDTELEEHSREASEAEEEIDEIQQENFQRPITVQHLMKLGGVLSAAAQVFKGTSQVLEGTSQDLERFSTRLSGHSKDIGSLVSECLQPSASQASTGISFGQPTNTATTSASSLSFKPPVTKQTKSAEGKNESTKVKETQSPKEITQIEAYEKQQETLS